MIYHQYESTAQFLQHWATEAQKTETAFQAVTEEAKGIKIDPRVKSLEQLSWHIVDIINKVGFNCGLLDSYAGELPVPDSMSVVLAAYKQAHEQVAQSVKDRWPDSLLDSETSLFGTQWKRGAILDLLLGHERHHRSQMTVVMRMTGLRVPGFYGPSKEEWEDMGITAPN